MNDFVFEKSSNSNIIKSIRFSEELNDKINAVVEEANKGKKNILLMVLLFQLVSMLWII